MLDREHRPRLLRFLSRRISNDVAEDLAQQAFARLAALDGNVVAISSVMGSNREWVLGRGALSPFQSLALLLIAE